MKAAYMTGSDRHIYTSSCPLKLRTCFFSCDRRKGDRCTFDNTWSKQILKLEPRPRDNTSEVESGEQINPKMERAAARRAADKAKAARWDLDVAILLFAVLIIIIILPFQGIGIEITAPVAVLGLAMVWFVGWRREKRLYSRFYEEELHQELKKVVTATVEETIEAQVQKALRERWR